MTQDDKEALLRCVQCQFDPTLTLNDIDVIEASGFIFEIDMFEFTKFSYRDSQVRIVVKSGWKNESHDMTTEVLNMIRNFKAFYLREK